MQAIIKSVVLLSLISFMVWPGCATGTERSGGRSEKNDDKTLSPYFFVKSDDPAVDQLPLKSTSADVNISGVIADVKVTQIYKNEGKRPIEAIYVFPASTRAAVYGVRMTIGERVIVAKIKKRDDARREYEQARQEGRSASLLEQQRPNVFQMNVANIMPGDIIKVELNYTELLVPEDGMYEFIYPTVVGPRYSNQPAETAAPQDKWVANPYTHQGEVPIYSFDSAVKVAAGLPVRDIYCASHKVNVAYDGLASASIKLDGSESKGGNRDYILKYRLEGEKIETGLLLYKGETENFFLLMMQPPKRVALSQIPGREYIFIVDVSGSMYGFPLEISKKLLGDLIGKLRPTDIFNVILFSGGSSVMSEHSLPATSENIKRALFMIDSQKGGGGTELLPALKRSLSLPRTEGYSRSVIIATDGYVTVETEAFDLIRKHLGDANMFTFGIGSSVNRYLLEGMARAGMGEPFVIASEAEAAAKAEKFRKIVQSPVLTGIKLDLGKFDVYDVEPLSVPDVMADRPVIVFGKWRGKPRGTITLTGTSGNGQYTATINVGAVKPAESNSALKYLWARSRIAVLSDYNVLQSDSRRTEEVTQLGLKYNLLTAYTSFLAVDSEVRNRDGQSTTINQPLPLPEGVSDYAVGRYMGAPSATGIMYKAARPAADASHGGLMARQESGYGAAEKVKEHPQVSIEKVEVSDPSAAEKIEKVAGSRAHELQSCNRGHLHGRMIVKLVIGADGKVKKAVVTSDGIKDKKLRKCITEATRKWRFDTPPPCADMIVKITLAF
ncbi:MAG TPA: VIT domain-containing protein [Dissulfurispiraceae bacterium]|nr:VIT domain-containing protein [Dissulfurispiraceae bacterium]